MKNQVKAKMLAGGKTLGTFFETGSATVAEGSPISQKPSPSGDGGPLAVDEGSISFNKIILGGYYHGYYQSRSQVLQVP